MSAEINDIPESIILQILSYLPVKERCISGRVCKKWRRIVNDNSLWRHVDLLPYKLNLKKTWKLLRSHLSDCLLSIKFRGFLEATGTKWKASTVSNAVLEDLQSRCPNIKELVLYNTCIDSVDSKKLPSTLTSLTLEGCSWTKGWLKNASLPHLRELKMDRTSRIDDAEVLDFLKFPTIETLSLKGCYRISDKGVRSISENLSNLVSLNLSSTGCTDLSTHFMSRNLKLLRYLYISNNDKLTNEAVEVLAAGLSKLEILELFSCKQIDEVCIDSVIKLKSLKTLCNDMRLSDDSLQKLELNGITVNTHLEDAIFRC